MFFLFFLDQNMSLVYILKKNNHDDHQTIQMTEIFSEGEDDHQRLERRSSETGFVSLNFESPSSASSRIRENLENGKFRVPSSTSYHQQPNHHQDNLSSLATYNNVIIGKNHSSPKHLLVLQSRRTFYLIVFLLILGIALLVFFAVATVITYSHCKYKS